MSSVENSSDPLVPCKASALKGDERDSDEPAFQESADPAGLAETQPPHFSIRDYVLNLRSKDVTKNWPFPCKFLQLCLECGVKDILPPFESPDLVRAQFCRRGAESQQQIACSYSEQISAEVKPLETKDVGRDDDEEPNIIMHELCLPPDQLAIECSNRAQNLSSKSMKPKIDHKIHSGDELIGVEAEPISTITGHDQIERISGKISELPCTVHVTKCASGGSLALEVGEPPLLPEKLDVRHESSENKCKLIVKLSSTSETIQGEDIVSTSSTVSDTMASKVCPVCKTFTSTSNTTLNAHIDQCLSEDFKTMRRMTELSKLRAKPRKKRLMVDIYTTAPHCTIEDLDRRNGTNWATDLTLVAPTREVGTEVKRSKLSMSGTINDVNEGAVYVDSNGTKLRILSKFNDVPREDFKLRKHVKGIKAGRSSLISKKKCLKSKYSKCAEISQRNKRLHSLELFKEKTQVTQIGDCHSSTYEEKEESLSCILNAQDQVKGHGPGTLRQWVCSKRSGPSRKLDKKGYDKSMESTVPSTMDTLVEGNQSNPADSSVVKSHILKLSRSSEDLLSSTKTKRVDVLSNSVHATYNGKTRPPKPLDSNSGLSPQNISSESALMLKLTRSSRNFVSSPRSQREEINLSTIHKTDSSSDIAIIPYGSCHPSLKTKKRLMPKNNVLLGKSSSLEVSKGDEREKRSTIRKFSKQRSILSNGKQREKLPSGINKGLHASPEYVGFEYSPRANETSNADLPNFSETIPISSVPGSERERDAFCTMAKQESTKTKLHMGADCYSFDVEASDMQHEPLDCEDITNDHSMDKAVDEHGGSENLIIQCLTPASSPELDPWPSGQEHLESVCGSEAPVESGLIDEQVMLCHDVASNKIINKNIEKVGEEGNLFRVMQLEDQTKTSIKGSSTCLIGHVDMVPESPQKNSSATSMRMTSSQDHNLHGGVEASASPSTSSNISLRSPEVSQSEDANKEQFVRHNADQDNLSSSFSNNSELPSIVNIRGTEGMKEEKRDQKVKAIAVAQEPEKLSDDQPCCCFHRESLSQESLQLLRQSIMTNSVFPSKVKQVVSNPCIRPVILSSSAFHSLRAGEMSAPILESPTESILTKTPSDLASKIPPGIDSRPPSPYSQAQGQASSNPLLRLMGKDLIVKTEELAEHHTILPCDTDFASKVKSLPPGFTSTNCGSSKVSFSCQQHQVSSGSTMRSKASSKTKQQISGFVGLGSMKCQQKRAKKLHNPLPCSIKRMAASHHHQKPISSAQAPNSDVIVIDDSPGIEVEPNRSIPSPVVTSPPAFPASNLIPPWPCSYLSPKNPFVSREVSGMIRPASISYPMANSYIPVKHDSTLEGSVPCSSYMFRSPLTAHLTPSLHYSRTLE
ncbi:uncharacterized protein [Elaeis guineensis]|uniref:Uncharacterized protein LOC105039516 n=1 Tax=Elaeis guineensis var. tenera TaxID=51953 RepID=A0A6J0PEJ1_ELAGV|nr:uncharacterized protein LOC105039516 [Elaeis guineensis]XP_019702851.1 uncharacterized protein LOC105039516 [Elaeis guineensis]XP_019702852.1 uncharacterized protein LOC105039516 [Elaeis guineensis]XP_019702853.1 uncharacterized protein LOC105039516 [Elaeis guineensis]XP_019702855.1 uncharacterized protein LOC105039516 [Elaeis guineensis]